LVDEVREECAKFGVLNDIIIPREVGNGVEASALRKVFLLYASTRDALQAEKELAGRQFGSNVVDTLYYPEQAFIAGLLR
jgi:splicing factor U2AF 65 kDa subunit